MGTSSLDEGTTSNRYTIIGRLAGGGMADIYIAKVSTEGGVERYVVLKRVLDTRSRDQTFARMFLDEARLAAQLQHPNIAQVHDVGKLAGSYFFTMEYVHGEDVRALMYRLATLRRPLPIHHALHIAIGALSALHHAHERKGPDGVSLGVVHRDVSPSNVMVAYEGTVKLLDFGVAKATQRTAESHAGTIKGKIAYLSPEQCEGKEVDRRSDLFSLGILLFEMLTGRRLYKRDSDFKAMMAIVQEPTPVPSSRRPEISSGLDAVVLKALAKDPAQRYANAEEMLEALETVAETDRIPLSAASMGRFMRELFGERKEPWIELPVHDPDENLTVTGKSLTTGDVLPTQSRLEPDAQFAAQLASAPTLGRPIIAEVSPSPIPGTPPAGVPVRETPVGGIPITRPSAAVSTLKETGASTAVEIPSKLEPSEPAEPDIAMGRVKTRDGVTPAKVAAPPVPVGSTTASWAALAEPSRAGTSPPVRPATAPPSEPSVIVTPQVPASAGTSLAAGTPADAPGLLPPPPAPTPAPAPPPAAPALAAIPALPSPAPKSDPNAPRSKTPTGAGKPFPGIPPIAPSTVVEAKPFTGTMPLPNLGELLKAAAAPATPETPAAKTPVVQAIPEATDDAIDRPSRRLATVIGAGPEPRPPSRLLRHNTEDGDTIPPLVDDPPPILGLSVADVRRFETAPVTEPSIMDIPVSEPADVPAGDAVDSALSALDDEDQAKPATDTDGSGEAHGDDEARADARASSAAGTDDDEHDPVAFEQAQAKRRQLFFIGGAMAVVLAIGVGILVGRGARSRKPTGQHGAARDAGIAVPLALDAQVVDAAEPEAIDAAVEPVDAELAEVVVDAAAEPVAVDAAVSPPADAAVAPISIADAAAAEDWAGVLTACAATNQRSAADATACALAACTLAKRTLAVQYAKRVAKADRAVVERACKASGITLGAAPKKPTGPTVDPCEANPLKCQK